MRSQIFNFINSTITLALFVLAGLVPLVFFNLTTDFYDMPKLIILVVVTLILFGLWIISWIIHGKIVITRTPLDTPLLLLLFTILASTFFSSSKNSSIYGIFPEVHGSAVSWATYIVLYFVAVSNLKKEGQIKFFLQTLLGSSVIVSLISILSYFGIFLPLELAKRVNFSPAGTTFSTVSLLLMLLPLTLISIVRRNKFLPQPLALATSVLFGMAIVLIGSVSVYILLLIIYGICLLIVKNHLSDKNLVLFMAPFAVALLMSMLSYIPFAGNKLYEIKNNFPQEVQLPPIVSWKISVTAFRDMPFLGTGPSTFLYNFTSYKPIEFNQMVFWNFSFGTAYNEFLQFLGTLGLLGFLALTVFCGYVFIYGIKYIFLRKPDEIQDDAHILLPGLALSGLVAVTLLLIHASTLISVVTMLFLMVSFMVSQKHVREKVSEFSMGIKVSTSDNRQLDFLPVIIFILFLVGIVPLSLRIYKTVMADYYHRKALQQASVDGVKTYEYLQKAESLNPQIDLYRVDMAQTNFALANALASQKGPTSENPEGTLTDDDKQKIQALITQAINEGRASVVLSPRSAKNWEVLALIYRNITGVANNSLAFSLDAYGRAIQLDPLNPVLRVNVGLIYQSTNNYDLAVRFFTDAVNLKPDYINGYYNLAIALRDKGDLENARIVAEQAISLLQKDLGSKDIKTIPDELRDVKVRDYNTATELLNEIKNKIDSSSQDQTGSALQNPNLPSINVPSLENPPETSVPPSVEESPVTNIPQITP